MKKENLASLLYCVSALCFFIAAAIEFFSGDKTSMAIMHLCLGGTFLGLASVNMNRNCESGKETEEDKKGEENKDEENN